MPQVLVTQRIEGLERRTYAVGVVATFSDAAIVALLKSQRQVDDTPAVVAAALAAGATQITHVPGKPADPALLEMENDVDLGEPNLKLRGVRAVSKAINSKPFAHYQRNGNDFSAAMRDAVEDQCDYAWTRKGRTFVVNLQGFQYAWDGDPIDLPPWARFATPGGVDVDCTGATQPVLWVRSDRDGFMPPGQYLQSKNQMGEIFDTTKGPLFLADGTLAAGGAAIRIGTGDGVYGDLYDPTGKPDIPYTIMVGISGIVWKGFDESIQLGNYSNFCIYLHDLRGDGNRKGIVTSSAAGTDFGELFRCERLFLSNNYLSNIELNAAHQLSFLHSSLTTPQEGARHIVFNAEGGHVIFGQGRFEGGDCISYSAGDFDRALLMMTNPELIPTPKVSGSLQPHHMRKFFKGGRHMVRGAVEIALHGNTPYLTTFAGMDNYLMADAAVDIDLDVTVRQNSNSEFRHQAPIQSRAQFIRSPRNNVGARGWVHRNATMSPAVADAPPDVRLAANPLTTANGSATVFMTWPGHGKQNGDQVVVAGAADTNGLLAAAINGLRTLTFVNANTVSFAAGAGVANANTAGGGAAVTVSGPSLSLTLANQRGQVVSPFRPVMQGRRYAGDVPLKVMAASAPTAPFIVYMQVMWYGGAGLIAPKTDPLTTTNGSATVTLAWPTHGRVDGESVTISGAVDTGGIAAASLNGVRPLTIVDDNTVTFVAGAAATGGVVGGGAGVRISVDREYISSSALARQGFAAGKVPSNYDVWLRHGGTGVVQAPAGAEVARLKVITEAAHSGELRVADSMAALADCR